MKCIACTARVRTVWQVRPGASRLGGCGGHKVGARARRAVGVWRGIAGSISTQLPVRAPPPAGP
eukprot:3409212-Lingulodinium_polyedra.AAC.1